MRPSLTFRSAIFLMCAAAVAAVRAGQPPAPPASGRQAPKAAAQFPGIPNGHQFSLAPPRAETARVEETRVVCGMIVIPGHADHDRKILRPVSPDSPKGVIESVEGRCEGPAAVNVAPPSQPAR